jgi:hypothetical protein
VHPGRAGADFQEDEAVKVWNALSASLRGSAGQVWLAAAGGLIFWAILAWGYAGIPPDFYLFRDDGVITLSHGRNWVDHGFIGINPSGERIEASSAPLQLLLYAAAYAVSGLHYETFMSLQTLVCTVVIGAMFALLFAERPLFALGATAVAALVLTRLPAFMVWHGSGMENALTHVFLLWTVLLLLAFARSGRIRPGWAVVPFLASICRVDAIFHVAPVLLVFCIYWHWTVHDRQARRLAATVAALWLLFNAARYAYFGALMPNTAVAQGISVGDRLMELLTLSPTYLDQSFGLARTLSSRHGAYLLLLVLPFVVFHPPPGRASMGLVLAATLILSAFATPFAFGPARLDTGRTTTHMALFVTVALAAAIYHWTPRRADLYGIAVAAVLVFLVHEYVRGSPVSACCSARGFENFRKAFDGIAREQGIARPTVANPDLGAISWHKQFNVVDLGLLGSSLMPRLDQGAPMREYFFEHAAPDIIESHGWWTCQYAGLLRDARFAERYVQAGTPAPGLGCKGGGLVPAGIWVRRDVLRGSPSAERVLMDALARQPSVDLLAQALRSCQASRPGRIDCSYVARAAYRALPELRAQGAQRELEALFATSRTREVDLFMMTGARDPRAWRGALAALQPAP